MTSVRRSSKRRSSKRLRTNAAALPRNLTVPEARKGRAGFLNSLTDGDIEIIRWIAKDGHLLFGSMLGGAGVFVARAKKRRGKDDMRRDDHAATKAVSLVNRGWLRFSPGPEGTNGYFWLTSSAETVLHVLDEKEGLLLWAQRLGDIQ